MLENPPFGEEAVSLSTVSAVSWAAVIAGAVAAAAISIVLLICGTGLGLSDLDFDALFTRDKPVIFAFHAYPWLIHRLTYRRNNHENIHVRGYKEEGTVTTPFDMTVLNELDRFHLVMDAINRLPQTGDRGIYLKKQLRDKLVEHRQYIGQHGRDMPEVRDWIWGGEKPVHPVQ